MSEDHERGYELAKGIYLRRAAEAERQALAFRQRAIDAEAALEAGGAEWTRMAEQHNRLVGQVAGLREVLSEAEWVLSVEHESLSRHDNHGANYACKGCETLGKIRVLGAPEPAGGPARGDEAPAAADGEGDPVAGTSGSCCAVHFTGKWPIMHVCSVCGNKRCPKATDCANECTGSNEPGQKGSRYA